MTYSTTDYFREFQRLSDLIDDGIETLKRESSNEAHAEKAYRENKSAAWLVCPNDPIGTKLGDKQWHSARRADWVDSKAAEYRLNRDIARGLAKSALESVRSRRAQVSAMQSMLNAYREEMAFERTAPGGVRP